MVYDPVVVIHTSRRRAMTLTRKNLIVDAARVRRCSLTAVTVAELHAGALSPHQAALIDRLAALFTRDERLPAPVADEWAAAGRLVARAIARRGMMEPRDHYPDALIALLAG